MFILTHNTKLPVAVDEEDYLRLTGYVWIDRGASIGRIITKNRKQTYISMASEIMNRPGVLFDHIDRNRFNNKKSNLREATISQNSMNRSKGKGCSSQYKGVCWDKRSSIWVAGIKLNGVRINLGSFENEIDAAKAYNKAALDLFKEFAHINEIPS